MSRNKFLRGTALCMLVMGLVGAQPARGDEPPAGRVVDDLIEEGLDDKGELRLLVNRSRLITTSRPYTRVSVAHPDLATINPINPHSFLLTARQAGATQLIVWDEADRSQVVELMVAFDIKTLTDQYQTLFPTSQIEATVWNGSLTLTGRVPDIEVAQQAAEIAGTYAPRVLNLLKVPEGQQVMLQVRFAEVSRTAISALGVNFGYTDGVALGGSNIGQVSPLSIEQVGPGVIGLGVPPPSGSVTIFGRAEVGRTALNYFLSALRQNNLLRILAEPNLTAANGQEASFLAGGDFPVPVVQGGGAAGATSLTVEYREFGVRLTFTPIVLGDGRIRLKMAPEVSDVDFTNAVRASGFLIPGRRTRNLSTTIDLHSGQTFAVAGLLDNRVTASKDVTPVLGDLPVLGALFRSVRYQRNETELVVLVTPRVVEAVADEELPTAPSERWRHPSEKDLFLNQDLGGPVAPEELRTPPPLFRGKYGFVPEPHDQ